MREPELEFIKHETTDHVGTRIIVITRVEGEDYPEDDRWAGFISPKVEIDRLPDDLHEGSELLLDAHVEEPEDLIVEDGFRLDELSDEQRSQLQVGSVLHQHDFAVEKAYTHPQTGERIKYRSHEAVYCVSPTVLTAGELEGFAQSTWERIEKPLEARIAELREDEAKRQNELNKVRASETFKPFNPPEKVELTESAVVIAPEHILDIGEKEVEWQVFVNPRIIGIPIRPPKSEVAGYKVPTKVYPLDLQEPEPIDEEDEEQARYAMHGYLCAFIGNEYTPQELMCLRLLVEIEGQKWMGRPDPEHEVLSQGRDSIYFQDFYPVLGGNRPMRFADQPCHIMLPLYDPGIYNIEFTIVEE